MFIFCKADEAFWSGICWPLSKLWSTHASTGWRTFPLALNMQSLIFPKFWRGFSRPVLMHCSLGLLFQINRHINSFQQLLSSSSQWVKACLRLMLVFQHKLKCLIFLNQCITYLQDQLSSLVRLLLHHKRCQCCMLRQIGLLLLDLSSPNKIHNFRTIICLMQLPQECHSLHPILWALIVT